MTTLDMFASARASAPEKAPHTGLLVTNHLNLMYMLSAGLLMPPAGFGNKYYRDTLECCPGWIPLFVDKVPRAAIESSIQEAEHLKPVIVQIDLSRMSGTLVAIGDNSSRGLRFPNEVDGTEHVFLVPAPLPVSWIESIVFRSADDKQGCERDAKDFGNVPLEAFRRDARRKALYTKASAASWPPSKELSERTVPLERPLAAGGAMAMLYLFGNLGDQAVRACRSAFDPEGGSDQPAGEHPILVGLGFWMQHGETPPPAPAEPETDRTGLQNAFQAGLYWEALERLVEWRDSGRAGSAEDVVLDHLAEASASLDPRAQAGIRKLRGTLESLGGLADATASELFERHDTPFARALSLFFLRRDCADLFDYRSDRLGEVDWLTAAVLFGVRDGWLDLPLRLRAHPGLANAVSYRMARMSHRIAGTDLDLGEPPARVRPLRERFGDGSAWRSGEKSAALELARAQKWDCVHTRIRLGPGEYKITVKGGSAYLELPGKPRISPEIDLARFLDLLSNARLDRELEARVRRKLGV